MWASDAYLAHARHTLVQADGAPLAGWLVGAADWDNLIKQPASDRPASLESFASSW